jgi:hypothetical protein
VTVRRFDDVDARTSLDRRVLQPAVIDQKTARLCAALIVLMLAVAVGRIITLEPWTVAVDNGAVITVPSLRPLIFPA